MQINKKDIIRFREGLKVEYTELGWLVQLGQEKLRLNSASLIILHIFSKWISIEEGTKLLAEKCNHKNDFFGISSNFHELLRKGFFELKNGDKNTFGFHNGKFDSFPVHIRMLNDKARTLSFQKAIRETVTPNDIVLDIGTGNGILAATAALCGAKHVYAIERSEFVEVAKAVFKANGLEDKITVLKGESTQIELPEKATVLVSEIIGNDPFNEGILRTFDDAKKRLLTSDAKMIPQSLKVMAVALECEEEKYNQNYLSHQNLQNWKEWYGVDFKAMLEFYDNKETQKINQKSIEVKNWKNLSNPIELSSADFGTNKNTVQDKVIDIPINAAGNFTAVLLYFETQLSEKTSLSLDPKKVNESNHWVSQLFLKESETVKEGEIYQLKYELKKLKSNISIKKLR